MEELVLKASLSAEATIREFELTQGGSELADADVVVKPWLPSVARGGGCFKR